MTKKLELEHIAKIEGHAKLHVSIKDGAIEDVSLQVLDGSRFFSGILKGKRFNDISHIASRICGVCSVSHSLAAIKAVETAYSIDVSEQTQKLRELLSIGGIIQSHALHLYFLTLPDYLGVGSALALASKDKNIIERALRLKRLGNKMVFVVAGRDVHPIGCVIGGFSRTPDKIAMAELLAELKECKNLAIETVEQFIGLDYPDVSLEAPHVTLGGESYFYSDKLIRCGGEKCYPVAEYKDHIKQNLRKGAPTEFVTKEGKSYFVGALVRICNNIDSLSAESKEYAGRICEWKDNPFMNIPAQAIEILEGVTRSIEILSSLALVDEKPQPEPEKFAATGGIAACEAPRGVLFHSYEFDDEGRCVDAEITTPTSQNLQHIEKSIKAYLETMLDANHDVVVKEIEKLIRAFDPCISCSTHFLDIEWEVE